MPEGSVEDDDDGLPEDRDDDSNDPQILVDKKAIHEALKRSRERHTVHIRSVLP